MDPTDDFIKLLQQAQGAVGATGQDYNRWVRLVAQRLGIDEGQAGSLLNSAMEASQRQFASTQNAYSDSDVLGKIKQFGNNAAQKYVNKFSTEAPAWAEDMGSRVNASAGMGDLVSRYMLAQQAQGDALDPMSNFARYLTGQQQDPRPRL